MKNKIGYEYISTLENPQTYRYSEFSGRKFIDSYKNFRLKMMDSLKVDRENLDMPIKNYAGQFAGLNKKKLFKKISEENFTKNILSMFCESNTVPILLLSFMSTGSMPRSL